MNMTFANYLGRCPPRSPPVDRHTRSAWLIVLTMLAVAMVAAFPALAQTSIAPPTNHLINSGSPYLLQHAHNPVDWYPWNEEAIAKARKEHKLIFLSVGYSTCYWCHVAERTIYSNSAMAALMNEWFVNIKVDREERPDLDETYMLARQMLTGEGGWPNNVFLTPDLKPFFAGSYFPPEDQGGATGFPTLLRLIHEEWQKNPSKIIGIGDQLYAALARARNSGGKPQSIMKIMPSAWLAAARDRILSRRDVLSGGFDGGGATKFPQAPLLGLLLTDYRLNGTTDSLQTVAEALNAMAQGGIHDHLGGGMFRYSTEPTWSVPHFEKMLYDNAQLLRLCADLYAINRNPLIRLMAVDIAGYLQSHMMAQEGGFYTAEDAEIDGKEGETYLWTKPEITALLGATDTQRLFTLYDLTPMPRETGGAGVLRIRMDRTSGPSSSSQGDLLRALTELRPLRVKLLEARERRRQPARDDKIVVALNGLAIAGLVHAGTVLGEPKWIESAKRAAERLWLQAYDEKMGKLRRYLNTGKAWGDGFLDDYALLGLSFIAISEATNEPEWQSRAGTLAHQIMERFIKPDGTVVTAAADPNLIVPAIDLQDYDTPSGTSAAYALLARLGKSQPQFAEAATRILSLMAAKIEASPDSWATLTASAAKFGVPGQSTAQPTSLDSAAYVTATAKSEGAGDRDRIVLTLTIAPGYHINANPASADYLIPTTVKLPGDASANVTYPPAQTFRPKFLAEGISVYEGAPVIKIETPHGGLVAAKREPLTVELQVCNLQVCLPPAIISVGEITPR